MAEDEGDGPYVLQLVYYRLKVVALNELHLLEELLMDSEASNWEGTGIPPMREDSQLV